MRILEFALDQAYEPGSNRGGEQADTTWLFLMTRLELGRAVVLGRPDPVLLAAVGGRASTVATAPTPGAPAPPLDEGTDFVYVTGPAAGTVLQDEGVRARFRGILHRGGAVFFESTRGADRSLTKLLTECGVGAVAELEAKGAFAGRALDLASPQPESATPRVVALALPDGVSKTAGVLRRGWRRVLRKALAAAGLRAAATASPGGEPIAIARLSTPIDRLRGRAILLRHSADGAVALPAYIRDVAGAAGYELGSGGWSILPPRGFRSQKVVFTVEGDAPAIVKVTQEREFNTRLANEYAALRALEDLPPGLVTLPRGLFCGEHAGLLVVGETRLEGAPFRERSDGTAACPVAAAVIDALVALGDVRRRPCAGAEVASALLSLLAEHRRVHDPAPEQLRLLEQQIGMIAETPDFATTFTHGDPSTLNILVRDHEIGLVDWENAEALGMPLWDLFYFVNAYAAWGAELVGVRYNPAQARSRLLGHSPWCELLRRAVARSCEGLELAPELVDPLFVTFWMQLALREATRLPPGAAGRGRYARLLAELVARPAPGRLVHGPG